MMNYNLIQNTSSAGVKINVFALLAQEANLSPSPSSFLNMEFDSDQNIIDILSIREDVESELSNVILNLYEDFQRLKKQWENDTFHLSSITAICTHFAYQQIVGMGMIAIPFILSSMKEEPGHWFWALKSITGEDPVLPEHRGVMTQMTNSWLRWGRERGYISE